MTPVKKTHEEIEAVEVSAIEKANGGISNVSLLILTSASLMLNVFCIYLLMGYSVSVTNMSDPLGIKRALLEVEYQKVGGRENYDLLNQAQLIQLKQQLPQVKQYIESQGGETATQSPEATPSQNTTLTPEQVKKLQENAAIE